MIIATGQRDFLAESVLITSWQDRSHKLHEVVDVVAGARAWRTTKPQCTEVGNDSQRSRYELPLSLLISATEEWIGRSSSGEDTSSRYSVGPRC